MKHRISKPTMQTFLALTVLLAVSLGCNLIKQLSPNSPDTPPTVSNTAKSNSRTVTGLSGGDGGEKLFESQKTLEDVFAKLKETLGTDNPNFLDILIYDKYVMVKVQDPKKPENIDGYTYRDGALSDPAPVKIMGSGKIEDNIFPLKDVNIDQIPALSEEVNEKLKDVEGGKIIGYSIKRGLPFTKNVRILVLTDATRKSVSAEASASGKLTKFEVK